MTIEAEGTSLFVISRADSPELVTVMITDDHTGAVANDLTVEEAKKMARDLLVMAKLAEFTSVKAP